MYIGAKDVSPLESVCVCVCVHTCIETGTVDTVVQTGKL